MRDPTPKFAFSFLFQLQPPTYRGKPLGNMLTTIDLTDVEASSQDIGICRCAKANCEHCKDENSNFLTGSGVLAAPSGFWFDPPL